MNLIKYSTEIVNHAKLICELIKGVPETERTLCIHFARIGSSNAQSPTDQKLRIHARSERHLTSEKVANNY